MLGGIVSISAPQTNEQQKITNYNEDKNNFSMDAPAHARGGGE